MSVDVEQPPTIEAVEILGRCAVSDCQHGVHPPQQVCDACSIRGRRSVQLLSERWLQLRAALVPGAAASTSRIARAVPASRAPVSSAALDAMESVEHLLISTDTDARVVLALPARAYGGVRAGVNVARSQTFLIAQWDRLTCTVIAGTVIDDLLVLRNRVDRVLGLGQLVHRLPAPCPRCDNLTLGRYDGDAFVRCLVCGSSWSEAEYRHLVRVLAADLTPGRKAPPT